MLSSIFSLSKLFKILLKITNELNYSINLSYFTTNNYLYSMSNILTNKVTHCFKIDA